MPAFALAGPGFYDLSCHSERVRERERYRERERERYREKEREIQ